MAHNAGPPVTICSLDGSGQPAPASSTSPVPVTLDTAALADLAALADFVATLTVSNGNLEVTLKDDDDAGMDFDDEAPAGGGIAHDAADSGKPLKTGAKAVATISSQTSVAANDRTDVFSDLDGVRPVRLGANHGDYVSGVASNTDGASTEVIAAGAANVKHYLTDVTIANSSASFVYVEIKDGTTVKWRFPVPATGGVTFSFKTPIAGSAATAWNFDSSAAASTLYYSASAYKSKV